MLRFASKILIILMTTVFLIESPSLTLASIQKATTIPQPPSIAGKSAIVIDSNTGQIIYGLKPYDWHYPASTTKTVTALLALQNLNMDKIITATQKACAITGDSSTAGIMTGEKLSVKNLLYALLLDSANEAANILAEQIGGNIKDFATMMNKKVKSLGGTNSNFVNPHGYHNKDHHTCAYDLSLVAMQDMKYPLFRKIVSTPIYKIPPTNKHPKGISLSNTNRLINKYRGSLYFYPYATGIKTGYTSNANHTLVSSAKKGNLDLIAVVLDSNNAFADTIKLYNYVFNNYKKLDVVKKATLLGTKKIKNGKLPLKACALNNFEYIVSNNVEATADMKLEYKNNLKLPIKKNSIVGTATYSLSGKLIGKVPLYAKETVKENSIVNKITKSSGFKSVVSVSKVIFLVFLCLVLCYISLLVWKYKARKNIWFKRK